MPIQTYEVSCEVRVVLSGVRVTLVHGLEDDEDMREALSNNIVDLVDGALSTTRAYGCIGKYIDLIDADVDDWEDE